MTREINMCYQAKDLKVWNLPQFNGINAKILKTDVLVCFYLLSYTRKYTYWGSRWGKNAHPVLYIYV